VQDIIEYTDTNNVSGCLISLDFLKAYDSLEWSFMIEALKKFNFGETFIKWVKILYTNPSMVFKNNGWLSSPIFPTRGIRQGCPFSALLFILSTEIMACSIRQERSIKGVNIGENEYKLSQYADDSYLFMNDVDSIDRAINLINYFTKAAGLKLNLEKTEGIWLGNYKDHPPDYCRIRFTDLPIKCLGIYVGHNKNMCDDFNWTPKIDKLNKLLNSWRGRDLSMFGKTLVLKTLGISSLMFNFMMLNVDDRRIKEINRILYSFIWNNKERIQRNTLIGDIDKGGIAMVDIESKVKTMKAGWIKHIVSEHKWSGVLKTSLNQLGFTTELLMKCNFTSVKSFPCISAVSEFYQQVFINFNKCKTLTARPCNDDIFSELLWGNEFFKYKDECLYEKKWLKSGIVYVKDLIYEDKFMDVDNLLSVLKCKSNWIAEYAKIRKVVSKRLQSADIQKAKYVNIKPKTYMYFMNQRFTDIRYVTNKDLYTIFVNKKFQRPKMEHMWCKEFILEKYQQTWQDIYKRKVKDMPIQKIKEFNFKLINNIVISGKIVSVWNKNVSATCNVCHEINTVKHMLYECERIQSVWRILSNLIKFDISWKQIVIGFNGDNDISTTYNIMIAITAYTIYAQWVKCINSDKVFKDVDILLCCKHSLLWNSCCLEYTTFKRFGFAIRKIIQKL
jgi:hypothetical protein